MSIKQKIKFKNSIDFEQDQQDGYQPTQKLKVEPMTLKALVRERIEAGKEMPTEIFGVFSENKTTIKRNK